MIKEKNINKHTTAEKYSDIAATASVQISYRGRYKCSPKKPANNGLFCIQL